MSLLAINLRRALRATSNWDCLAIHRVLMAERAWPKHRAASGRIIELLARLVGGEKFNCRNLAHMLNTSTKSIQRDIDFCRKMGVRITYVINDWSYALEPNQNHPWLQLANQLKEASR